jgi:hypothetical protein
MHAGAWKKNKSKTALTNVHGTQNKIKIEKPQGKNRTRRRKSVARGEGKMERELVKVTLRRRRSRRQDEEDDGAMAISCVLNPVCWDYNISLLISRACYCCLVPLQWRPPHILFSLLICYAQLGRVSRLLSEQLRSEPRTLNPHIVSLLLKLKENL